MITHFFRSIRDYHNYYLQLYRYDSLYGYNLLRWIYNVPIGLLSGVESLLLVTIKIPMELCGYRFNTPVGKDFQEAINAIRDSLFAPIVFCYNAIFVPRTDEPLDEKKAEELSEPPEISISTPSLEPSRDPSIGTKATTSVSTQTEEPLPPRHPEDAMIVPLSASITESATPPSTSIPTIPIQTDNQSHTNAAILQNVQNKEEKPAIPAEPSTPVNTSPVQNDLRAVVNIEPRVSGVPEEKSAGIAEEKQSPQNFDDSIPTPGPLELIEAVTARDGEKVRALLAHPKVTLEYINNNKNARGLTAWKVACRNGRNYIDVEIQMLFVQIKGVELPHPDNKSYRSYTPLNYIIKLTRYQRENYELLRQTAMKIIQQNDPAIINARDDFGQGRTALMMAVQCRWLEILQELLKLDCIKQIINAQTVHHYETALSKAVQQSWIEGVRALVAAKADVNLQSPHDYETALFKAAKKSWIEGVRELVAAKADANLQSIDGETALTIARNSKSIGLLQELLAGKPNLNVEVDGYGSPLFCYSKWPEGIRVLIDAKADINFKCPSDGNTALIYAVRYQSIFDYDSTMAGIQELLKYKEINLDLTNDEGDTALLAAAKRTIYFESGSRRCFGGIKELLKYKCNLFVKNKANKTALDIINDNIDNVRLNNSGDQALIDDLEDIKNILKSRMVDYTRRLNFMFGEHPRLGCSSSILRAKRNPMSEPKLFRIIFDLAASPDTIPDSIVNNQYLSNQLEAIER